jgi:hypothetical protein
METIGVENIPKAKEGSESAEEADYEQEGTEEGGDGDS